MSTEDGEDYDDEQGSTTSTARRWWLTNDVLAGWLVGTFALLLAADATLQAVSISGVPQVVVQSWVLFTGIAVAWTFGTDAVRAWRGNK
jgi:hypothetical protein